MAPNLDLSKEETAIGIDTKGKFQKHFWIGSAAHTAVGKYVLRRVVWRCDVRYARRPVC